MSDHLKPNLYEGTDTYTSVLHNDFYVSFIKRYLLYFCT